MYESIYIHIPFCKRRCHYCDFNTYAGMFDYVEAYISALITELRIVNLYPNNHKVHSIYIGGGTPSLVPVALYKLLLGAIREQFQLSNDCEISMEANPGTLTRAYLEGIAGLGVNRLSLGVQSTDPYDLERLDRIHTIDDVWVSIKNARSAGFANINLDLIFSLPWQDLLSWENNLKRALLLEPDHFSLYSLIIEPGTQLHGWYERGLIAEPDEDLEADMYESAMEILAASGYLHYEISNWARQDRLNDFRCRHNLQYWRNLPYYGIGAGAHGYIQNCRSINTSTIQDYIRRMESLRMPGESPAVVSRETVNALTQMKDFMLLGFRLVSDGVRPDEFERRYHTSMEMTFREEIAKLSRQGLIEWGDEQKSHLKLTHRGVMLANRVFQEFV